MAESPATPVSATRFSRALAGLRWLLLVLGVALVIVAVLLPTHVLAWLRSDYYAWIGRPLNWLDDASTAQLDLTHVAMFGAISLLVACLWPRVHAWRIAPWLLLLAVATEVVQFWVPGREPNFSDVYDNLFGIIVGLIVATPFRWLRRRTRTPP